MLGQASNKMEGMEEGFKKEDDEEYYDDNVKEEYEQF